MRTRPGGGVMGMRLGRAGGVLLCVALLGAAAGGAVRAGAPAEAPRDVVEYGLAGTVQIETKGAQKKIGSGFFVSPDGYLLTCEHVVAEDETVSVTTAGKKTFEGTVVARDRVNDLALVKIAARNVPAQVLGDSSQLYAGEAVMALGSPLGLNGTVTIGVVSNVARTVGKQTLIQTDVPVNPGLSGGALLDSKGRVVGVIAAMVKQAQDVGFAVPINAAAGLLTKANVAVSVVPTNKALAFQKSATKATPVEPEKPAKTTWWPFAVTFGVVAIVVVVLVLVLRRRARPGGVGDVQIAFRTPGSGAVHASSTPPPPSAPENLDDVDIELH